MDDNFQTKELTQFVNRVMMSPKGRGLKFMTERKAPTYNRQRLLLFLIEQAGGELSKMDLQKLLFLAHQGSSFDYYELVPYHYGCYSFQAADDLEGLEHKGWVESSDRHISLRDAAYLGAGA